MDKEADARAALHRFVAVGGIETWLAEQPWRPVPGGWTVAGELHGLRFRVEPVPGGVRVIASSGEGQPAVWFVPT